MKLNYACVLVSTLLFTAFSASSSAFGYQTNPSSTTVSSVMQKLTDAHEGSTSVKLPAHFTAYTSDSIGDGESCEVGAATDDDGLNQKPLAYVANTKSKQMIWVDRIDLPPNTFQSRATHCNRHGGMVFVLLQSDTQSEQTLSQTLLHVVKLDANTGALKAQRDVEVPAAYTAWVEEGESHFQWRGNVLTISGSYRPQSDQDAQRPFTVHLNSDLNP